MQVSTKSPIVMASRGARFLDLVRQNKLNISPQLNKLTNKRRFSMFEDDILNKRRSMNETLDKESKERDENKQKREEEKEYLSFSSSLKYNPNASPSSSILSSSKRKADESIDASPLTSAKVR
jgi:hypothetical protein